MLKLVSAVQCAHEHGVIHRDLKPANVLVVADRPELEIKVTDFGLAKFFLDEALFAYEVEHVSRHAQLHGAEQAGGRSERNWRRRPMSIRWARSCSSC